jgi:hypothetical protein
MVRIKPFPRETENKVIKKKRKREINSAGENNSYENCVICCFIFLMFFFLMLLNNGNDTCVCVKMCWFACVCVCGHVDIHVTVKEMDHGRDGIK